MIKFADTKVSICITKKDGNFLSSSSINLKFKITCTYHDLSLN